MRFLNLKIKLILELTASLELDAQTDTNRFLLPNAACRSIIVHSAIAGSWLNTN